MTDHFERLRTLIELESKAESEAALERARRLSPREAEESGVALLELAIEDESAGLGGRTILKLAKTRGRKLPWSRIDVGSPVLLSEDEPRGEHARAVVSSRSERHVEVALAEPPSGSADATYRLDLAHDEVSIDRQRYALKTVRAAKRDRLAELRDVLLGERQPSAFEESTEGLALLDRGLDASQASAVRFALASEDVALIHGPPGTGKTSTVVEVIRQAVRRREKVLASAPSNLAVDNILERLVAANVRAVRLGHPARVMPGLVPHTLDLLVAEHDDVRLARKLVKEALALRRKAEKYTRAKPLPGAREALRRESRELFADARRLEAGAIARILDGAEVVCATTSLDPEILRDRRFDLVVIDEACQSTEPGSWVPLTRAGRAVLAGDHLQLAPTILSAEAKAGGLSRSLFERIVDLYGDRVTRLLTTQYRMHASIMEFSSGELYGGALTAHASVASHVLADLPGVARVPLTETPAELIDTAGAGYDEALEPDGESRLNAEEAAIVEKKVRALIEAGVRAEWIAVIAPYAAQVRLIRRTFEALGMAGVEVDTVDGFQGREKEAIVISLVRSNASGEIGFLGDVRRMNVALTRARRKLIVIGDSATLAGEPFYARLFSYFEAIGGYRTVWEE